MRIVFLFLLFLYSLALIAQDPTYFQVGLKQLGDKQIYDLIQNNKGELLIATDQGVYKYDSYNVEKLIITSSARSGSFLNLKTNSKGEVYCHNLHGQFFEVKNDSVTLFYQLPDSNSSPYPSFDFNRSDEMMIISKRILKVDSNKNVQVLPKRPLALFNNPILETDNGELLAYERIENDFFSFDNYQLKGYKNIPVGIVENCVNDENLVLFDELNSMLYNYSNDTVQQQVQIEDEVRKVYKLNDKNLWIPLKKNGLYAFDKNLKRLFQGRKLFDNQFISAIYQDIENNIWLGTFNKGLLLIPNTNLLTIRPNKEEDNFAIVNSFDNNKFLIGTYNGPVYLIDEDLVNKKVYKNKIKSDIAIPLDGSPYFVIQNEPYTLSIRNSFNPEVSFPTELSACKKIFPLGNQEYLIVSQLWGTYLQLDSLATRNRTNPIKKFERFARIYRSTAAHYDLTNDFFYAGIGNGLIRFHLKDYLNAIQKGENVELIDLQKEEKLLFNGKNVIANSITQKENQILIGTRNQGILILENDSIYSLKELNKELPSQTIKKIEYQNDKLYISTDESFEIWDFELKSTSKLSHSEGISPSAVRDFALTDNTLCLITTSGLQTIALEEIKANKNLPQKSSLQVTVNGEVFELEDKELKSFENHIKFTVFSPAFVLKDLIQYKYRLSGVDKEWQYQSFDENEIEYKSLPPGEYNFEINIVADNKEKSLRQLSFSILHPIWLRTWFLLISGILIIIILFIVYRIVLKRQFEKTEKEKQLAQFKLKALQSQMNPHFIFNALNSIQDYVLQGDIENSYDYINDFSDLTRKTLNYSNLDFIHLNEEIETLQLYLSLEKLRFTKGFTYTIDNQVKKSLLLPPMIIQPFVENAIVHGLFHSENEKQLSIEFKYEDQLTCIIRDNGIGRQKAEEILKRQKRKHESFSSKAIKNRLTIFNQLYKNEFNVVYKDLFTHNSSSGTEVTLTIPVKENIVK